MTTTTTKGASHRHILLASLMGTAVEFYDFYIYATAASLVFGPLFFPAEDPQAQLLSAYASFGVAFIARPIGAMVFGHYGDRIGRKSTLVASLLIMGISTMLIAFLPGHAVIGWVAPLLLCILRFGQGFGLGGEWGGASLLAVENAPPEKRARYGMFPQLGAPVGFIISNGVFLLLAMLLTGDQFMAWGWRIPFLASAVLVGIGLYVRLALTETPAFTKALAEAPPAAVPLLEVVRTHPRELIAGSFAVIACYAIFYIATTFTLGYATSALGYDRETFLAMQLVAILFMALSIIFSGFWADKHNPRFVLMAGCIITVGASFFMAPLFQSHDVVAATALLSVLLFCMGLVYGPLSAWLPGLFAARVRYTGTSIAFNVGGILGGALTPFAAQALAAKGGLVFVGYYLAAAALLSFVALGAMGGRDRL